MFIARITLCKLASQKLKVHSEIIGITLVGIDHLCSTGLCASGSHIKKGHLTHHWTPLQNGLAESIGDVIRETDNRDVNVTIWWGKEDINTCCSVFISTL